MSDDPFGGGLAFREVGEHVRENYLRFDYTKGTKQEARFLREALALPDDALVLDVACGVGRHERHLPWRVVGADLTRGLLEVARRDARMAGLVQAEARALPFRPAFDGADEGPAGPLSASRSRARWRGFDGAWSVCEGAFGLLPDDAAHVEMLRSVRACLRPGAPFLLSAMSVFAMCADSHFDVATNVMRTPQTVRAPGGRKREFVVATRAFAPREVLSMAREAGFVVEALWGGVTGAYARRPLTVEDAEMLVLMRNPAPPG